MQGLATFKHPVLAQKEIVTSCYEREIPPFILAELEKLYGNVYSCLPYIRLYSTSNDLNAFVARQAGNISSIILFTFCRGKVEVLNKFVRIEQAEIERFAKFVFEKYPDAELISFPTVETDVSTMSFPFRQAVLTDDFVIDLPQSIEQYQASLGKSTRRLTQAGMKKLLAKYDDVRFEFFSNAQIDERHIHRIADMYIARLKEQKASYDPHMAERRIALSRQCDTIVGVVSVNGRIVAGSITYHIGNNYFASMLAHDPAYNEDHVGFLCAYRTVCESIARGGREFHFGQSRRRYKENLRCVQREMHRIEIFRSKTHLLLNYRRVAKMSLQSRLLQLEQWAKAPEHANHPICRYVAASLATLQRLYAAARTRQAKPAFAPAPSKVVPLETRRHSETSEGSANSRNAI